MHDEHAYTALVQDFSLTLNDYIEQRASGDKERRLVLRKFFMPAGVFDGLINVLVQQLTKRPIRPHLCDAQARYALLDQIVRKLEAACEAFDREPRTFSEVCEALPCVTLDLPKANLSSAFVELQERDALRYKLYLQGYHKTCYHHWRPKDVRRVTNTGFKGAFTGALLWGEQGCGKSQILSYLTAWAHESNWCSVAITDAEGFINAQNDILRYKNGLYLQKDLAQRLC